MLWSDRRRTKSLGNTALNLLEGKVHRAYTTAADELFLRGLITREDRIAYGGLIGDFLGQMREAVTAQLPALANTYVDPETVDVIAAQKASGFVVKEVNGVHRWVLISSSAFEDRDGEIVSIKALQMDVDRADSDGDFGTLRWWHIPGAELGDCDFNMLHGRMLYESGTFRSKQIAEAVKTNAHLLGASIGFTHPVSEPDSDGVFHNIKRFERSLLPREFASNPFTAVSLVEKESHMTLIEDKLKAFGKILGGDANTVAQVLALGATKEAEADLSGTRHKEKQECPVGFHWDEDKQDCVKDAPKEDAAPPPAEDKKEYMGDMTPEAFKHILTEVVDSRMTTLKAELQSQLDTAATTKEAAEKAYAESLKSLDAKLDGIATSAKAALDGVAELKGELPRRLGERLKGYHPSTDGDTPDESFKDKAPVSDTVVDKFMASLGVAPTN